MITTAKKYDHPMNGQYNETVATLEDGRMMTINTQYNVVCPNGKHADDCEQVNKMGGRCTCGMLAGIDTAALIDDARKNGKKGPAPIVETVTPMSADELAAMNMDLCPRCHTVCYGDCEAA